MKSKNEQINELLLQSWMRHGVSVRSAPMLLARESIGDGRGKQPHPDESEIQAIKWILTTEQPVMVFDWERYEFVQEILLVDGTTPPADGQIPLLDSHNRNSVANQLGSVREFSVGQAEGHKTIEGIVYFSEADELSRCTRGKVLEGHIRDGSIGYRVEKSVYIPDGEEAYVQGKIYTGPVKISYQSKLMEFSVTPIGADSLAKVRELCGSRSDRGAANAGRNS